MKTTKKLILHIGSNKGNRFENLQKSLEYIEENIGSIVNTSKIYETEPWGFESDEMFLNQVVVVETQFKPMDVLEKIKKIEKLMGREGSAKRYSSRTIDIDILFYENVIFSNDQLVIPHPLLHLRKFVLIPLVEILPDWVHPCMDMTIKELLEECTDDSIVNLYNPEEKNEN